MPYRTFDDRIEGLVITFIDITDLKLVEEKLHKFDQENRILINSSSEIIIKLFADWKILEFNSAAETFFGKKYGDVTGQNFMELFIPEALRKKTEQQMASVLKNPGINQIKLQVIAAGAREFDTEWFFIIHSNHLQSPSEIMIITKNIKI
jgi:two-component system, chemotaxis family, CheB/CheR fusion protein